MNNDLSIDSGSGLGEILKNNRLKVPLNQREYSWEQENVDEMLTDLNDAMKDNRTHFMGTVVMTRKGPELWEIADGQQRLATTTILLAVIRDILLEEGDEPRAGSIDHDFLFSIDPDSAQRMANLTLNADDNNFFYNRIVLRPKDRMKLAPTLDSHKRLLAAYQTTKSYFAGVRKVSGPKFVDTLMAWRRLLLASAKVLLLKVPESKGCDRQIM